jgi:chromosome segregation ATPase
VISLDSTTQSLHQCQQELNRIGTAHLSTNQEYVSCGERLLKQEAWAASLSATNNVLHNQLSKVKNNYALTQADYISTKELSLKCESTSKELIAAKDLALTKVKELEDYNTQLANSTASLNATSILLQKELLLANSANELLSETSANLTTQLESTIKNRDALAQDKKDMQSKLIALEAKAKELDQSLRAGESKYRAMTILEASQQAGRAVLEKKVDEATTQAFQAAGDKETLAIRNKELASQLSMTEKALVELKNEFEIKSIRLNELEQAMAALAAAEEVVISGNDGDNEKTISTCTGSSTNQTGGLCLTVRTGGSGGTATEALDKASNIAANIARSTGIKSPYEENNKNAHHHDETSDNLSKLDAPGLVAIAGAVAAVWVFAVIMEKRSSLYKK